MKKMIRLLSMILALIIVTGIACSACAEGETSTVYLTVRLNRNLLIAQRGVLVYMDDTEIGYIGQGNAMTVGLVLSEGQHQLKFLEEGYRDAYGTWTLGALPDQSFIFCTIQTHRKYVEVKDHTITNSEGNTLLTRNDTVDERGFVIDIIHAILK